MTQGVVKKYTKAIKARVKRYHPSHLLWAIDQKLRKLRMARLSVTPQFDEVKKALHDHAMTHRSRECLITITFGSRQFGNRDNLLENLLKSFLKMTEYPNKVEMLIKIDPDDDLLFYLRMQKKYSNRINLHFFVTDRGAGYREIHKWHSQLAEYRSPASRLLFIFSEDAEFCHLHWDTALLSLIKDIPHNLFVGTLSSLEETMTILGPNPVSPEPVYWIGGADFPIIGTDIFTCAKKVAAKYSDWVPLGNTFSVEGLAADFLRRLWQRHQVNLHIRTPMYVTRRGVFCWTANEERKSVRTQSWLKFFYEESQRVRDEIVDEIFKEYQKKQNTPASLSLIGK